MCEITNQNKYTMKINLERLEQLKTELFGDDYHPDYGNREPMGLQIIMDAVRGYLYTDHNNEVITKLLIDYGVLVEEETENQEENPIVKPFKFTTNG